MGLYAGLLAAYALCAGPARLTEHTAFNHFALQAQAWLSGHLDLGAPPPAYAQGNDFAQFQDRWYVTFPAFPAAILLPFVALAGGSATAVPDAVVFIALAPLGPLFFWAALKRLREQYQQGCSEAVARWLALGLGLGSVYWFSAVQGTVWFAAHVVGVVLAAGYFWAAIGAQHAAVAGWCLGLGFWTRTPLLFAAPLFLCELWRAWRASNRSWSWAARRLCRFAAPIAALGMLAALHNWARFGSPSDFGYERLAIAWRGRIDAWGLFHVHFLPRNLGIALTSLPWLRPLRVSGHGLALWFTTPLYCLLWRPASQRQALFWPLLVTAGAVALPTLLYQNTGWLQFGYRFSNDYAVFLFAALGVSGLRAGPFFYALSVWGFVVNAWGAVTFDKPKYAAFYDRSPPKVLYQPD